MAKGRKRRIWSDDEKRMICSQTRVPGVSVSQVARRYDVNANLVFTWLREAFRLDITAREVSAMAALIAASVSFSGASCLVCPSICPDLSTGGVRLKACSYAKGKPNSSPYYE